MASLLILIVSLCVALAGKSGEKGIYWPISLVSFVLLSGQQGAC